MARNVMMRRRFFLLGTAAAFLALAETGWTQWAPDWRVYKLADGLPESACSSVAVSLNGRVIVSHPDLGLISELDGYKIKVIPAPSAGIGVIRETPSGQIWAVNPNGLLEWDNKSWLVHPIPEIASEFRPNQAASIRRVPFCPILQGRVLFLLPERLMELNSQDSEHPTTSTLRTAADTKIGTFSGMTPSRDGGLWVSGARGVAKDAGPLRNLKPDDDWREYIPPEGLGIRNFRAPTEDNEGGVTMVAESTNAGQRVVVRFDGQHWTVLSAGGQKIFFAWYGPNRTFGAATAESLFDWRDGRMVENEEISARRYLGGAQGPGGALWLATSEGLFRSVLPLWRTPGSVENVNTIVYCLTRDSANRLWFVSGGNLHLVQDDGHREFPLPASVVQTPKVYSLFPLNNSTLLLMCGGIALQFHPDDASFTAVQLDEDVQRIVPLGTLQNGDVVVQSFTRRPGEPARLETFDGIRFRPFPHPSPDPEIGEESGAFLAAQNGDIWIGGVHGTALWHGEKWQSFVTSDSSTPTDPVAFVELLDGKIWCAGPDKIWQFDGANWFLVRGGFDRINAMLRGQDGSIWVASNSGIFRFWKDAWIENGVEEGLSSVAIHTVCQGPDGRIWAATARGLSLYHPEADPDAPKTQIQRLPEDNKKLQQGDTIYLYFAGVDKWKITARSRLLYSYRFDQQDWSPFQDLNAVSFPQLPAEKHFVQVRAMDRNGNVEKTAAEMDFSVALPWYEEKRLVFIASFGLAIALFFAALALNRHRQLLRSYAAVEHTIAERTRELEVANRELLHSQKMHALGTLAAGIAHDFNNILSIIKGSAQIIEDNPRDTRKILTRVDRIKTVVEQGSGIVNAMLGFSRRSDEQPALCNLNEVVGDTVKLLGDRFLREVEVRFRPTPRLPEVLIIRSFVQQILLNFIFNAAESMTDKKHIEVTTRHGYPQTSEVVLAPAHTGPHISISVRDSGCGIPAETLPRIFDPFFTTKALSTRRGTGLGLSMAYELAKKMEAGIAVESVVNQGSTFTLILPARALDAPQDTVTAAQSTTQP